MMENIPQLVAQKHMMLLKEIKKTLKGHLFDKNIQNKTLRTPELKYIASLRDREHLLTVADLLEKYEWKKALFHLDLQHLEALYLELDNDFNALFLALRERYNTLDSEKFNYGNDALITNELKKSLREKELTALAGYGFDTTVNILYSMELSIASKHRLSMDELNFLKLTNTQKEFVKYYHGYRTDPGQIASYDWEHYDHLKSFSLNYYAMIRVMADVYQNEGSRLDFTIHDAGTSTSQLALMLATLNQAELMGLKVKEVIASDLDLTCRDDTQRCLNQYTNPKPYRFVQRDFLDESQELPEADVTILNDVLEHFPDDERAFLVFSRLWQRTRKLFIVHVPQETKLGVEWGHHIIFNKAKLSQWANRLTGHRSLGDNYHFNEYTSYSDCGFLFLKRGVEN